VKSAFQDLQNRLFDEIAPNLARSPRLGRDFLTSAQVSDDVASRILALKKQTGKSLALREYITGDYLILYAIGRSNVFLLAIRHHLQLSFDLRGHWL
jgi:plasmid stabilization system protein ParE